MQTTLRRPLIFLAVVTAVLAAVPAGADWPHPRGPATDGQGDGSGILASEQLGLDNAWRISIGSGYSGIAVADGRVVTQFSAGDHNWAAAFDAMSGAELWRHATGPILKGLDGSDDGPLSSPAIGDGLVYTLDPRGSLAALRLEDGTVAWAKHLEKDLGATAPHFGFTTTPLVADNMVLIAGGGDEHAITGLNAKTGAIEWRAGSGGIEYQSPTLMTLAGTRQAVAITNTGIVGLQTATGTVLWHHPFGDDERANSAIPTFIGDDSFVTPLSGGIAAFQVAQGTEGWQVKERYRSDAMGRSYAQPVVNDGHLYGFRGQILVCMKAATGERVWRSRPPGGDGLILVDGRLVIFASKGAVVVADASPAGYKERARFASLAGSSLTWPSFDDGRIFIRNLEELAAVRTTQRRPAVSSADSMEEDHAFGHWLRQVGASDEPQSMVDALWTKHEQLPIVEGQYIHFLFRGDAEEVVLGGSLIDQGAADTLARLAGTDLFYRTYKLEPGGRWEYRFQTDFGDWVTDPRNPRTVPAVRGRGRYSEVVTPGYKIQSALAEPARRGNVERFTLTSKALETDKEIDVYLPPGYAEATSPYPLLVVNDGPAWLEKGQLATALDNLIGTRIAPVIVAFVPPAGPWWEEAGGSKTKEYAEMQAKELVPELAKRYRIASEASQRAVLGDRYYGLTTAWTALHHHDVFGHAAIFSPTLSQGHGDDLRAKIGAKEGPNVAFYVDWNRHDHIQVDRGADYGTEARALAASLRANGYALSGGEAADSHGWGAWRNRTGPMLEALFPLN